MSLGEKLGKSLEEILDLSWTELNLWAGYYGWKAEQKELESPEG